MEKITAASPEAQSADLVAGNIEQLKALFPELITEGPNGTAVNVDVLKALVGDRTVTDADEKYGLNWHGKRRARQLALTPSTGTPAGPTEAIGELGDDRLACGTAVMNGLLVKCASCLRSPKPVSGSTNVLVSVADSTKIRMAYEAAL